MDINKYLITYHLPDVFDPRSKNNVLKAQDDSFHNLCISLEEIGSTGRSDMIVFDFYASLTYYKEKALRSKSNS